MYRVNINKIPLFLAVALLVPEFAWAADFNLAGQNFKSLILTILSIMGILIPILFFGAFIVFFWGLSKFILNSGVPAEIQKGKNYMIWGVLALFILISFRTIIGLVTDEFGFGDASVVPTLETNGQTPETSGRIVPPPGF